MARVVLWATFSLLLTMSVLSHSRTAATTLHTKVKYTAREAAKEASKLVRRAPQATDSNVKHLEVVIATYHGDRMEESARIWEELLAIPKVKALQPFVTIYNQDPGGQSSGWLEDKMRAVLHNGRVIYLDNRGRESRVHMYHIVNHWDNLYRYTWFSQDIPSAHAADRIEALFTPGRTAMLGVGPSWAATCDDREWVEHIDRPTHLLGMVHELVKGKPCDASVWAAYKGEFIVSKERIHRNNFHLYQTLLELLEAPHDHPIHSKHGDGRFKDPSSPWFGHIMERSWSLLFNCSDLSMEEGCRDCENKGWKGCEPDSCQCTEV